MKELMSIKNWRPKNDRREALIRRTYEYVEKADYTRHFGLQNLLILEDWPKDNLWE